LSLATRRPAPLAALTALLAVGLLAATAATEASAAGLVAPLSECKAQKNIKAPEREQEDAMRCLINYARSHSGSGSLGASRSLERAAGQKSGDVMQCGFSHTACGRPADLYARRYGYASASSWAWGENLAVGRGKRGSARKVMKAWLHSPPHRDAMLRGSFDDAGIGLKRGRFSGHRNMAVWVLELGCQGCG